MTKVVRLATWEARLALDVVVDDGLWKSSIAGVVTIGYFCYKGHRSQRQPLNLIKFIFNVIFVIITKTVVINPYIRSCMNPYIATIRPNHIVNYFYSAKKFLFVNNLNIKL